MRGRSLNQMLHAPTRREATQALLAGLAIAAFCWYLGVNAWHSILLGCAITVTALALLVGGSAPDARDLSWRPGKRASREGSRSDIASLSASLRSGWGFVGLSAERRLQQIARRRLALEGLDLKNAEHRSAIEQHIGTPAYRVLVRPGGRLPRLRALLSCLDALDAIDPTNYPAPQPRARRWGPLSAIPSSLGRARER
jgi:hypothetical protein